MPLQKLHLTEPLPHPHFHAQFCSGGPLDSNVHEGFGLFDPVAAVQRAIKEAERLKLLKEAKGDGSSADDDGT